MRFGIFYEHQIPRPWSDGAEHKLLKDALDQVEIADRVGFDYVWQVEHHFLEEYSHGSAPEVFLAAASQRTKSIRLGHGIVQIPPAVNHPARVAERVATLDLISDGRVDFGTGESSSAAELGGFLVDRNEKRTQWEDAMDAIAHMFVEEPFAGWESEFIRMPPRNVIPKPLQKPHPPLWVACSRRETIHFAARNGIGALSFSFVEPEDAGKWVTEYYDLLASDECVPVGFAVNPSVSVVVPMMCHQDEQTAIDRGIDGAHFFGYSLAHYYGLSPHHPGTTNVWEEFQRRRGETGFAREIVRADKAPLGVKILQEGLGSLRGAIGTPEQIADLVRRYEAVGVDQVVFVLQAGDNRHEHISESLQLVGEQVIPAFAEGRDEREREKAERLAPAIEAALARRGPARAAPAGYRIDEEAELERAQPKRRHELPAPRELAAHALDELRHAARKRGQAGLARLVRDVPDDRLERRFGRAAVQRILFEGMARSFEPRFAFGFEGEIQYELTSRTNGGSPHRWTVTVKGDRASAAPGAAAKPTLVVRMPLVDFARIAANEIDPAVPLLEGRMEVEGDWAMLPRLSEMFGGKSNY